MTAHFQQSPLVSDFDAKFSEDLNDRVRNSTLVVYQPQGFLHVVNPEEYRGPEKPPRSSALARLLEAPLFSDFNPNYSTNTNERVRTSSSNVAYGPLELIHTVNPETVSAVRPGRTGALAYDYKSFSDNIHKKINILPTIIEDGVVVETTLDLGVITKTKSFVVNIWNISRNLTFELDEIIVPNGEGVVISGPGLPFNLRSRSHVQFNVAVTPIGEDVADTTIEFNFSNGPNPDVLQITGDRVLPLDIIPESPVRETWEWLTNILTSNDGTEQRHALRGSNPRVKNETQHIVDNLSRINRMKSYNKLTNLQRWVPEWQYASKLLKKVTKGESRLYFDPTPLDLRVGEFLLVHKSNQNTLMGKIQTIHSDGVSFETPVDEDLGQYCSIVTGGSAILDDGIQSSRYSVNEVATVAYSSVYQRGREDLLKPGTVSESQSFLGSNILSKRPLANSLVESSITQGMERIDNSVGLVRLVRKWTYPRLIGSREFQVIRKTDMNFWRHFLTEIKGQVKKFWMPTYRPDLTLCEEILPGASSMLVEEGFYSESVFEGLPTHRYLDIETRGGNHRVTVTEAIVESGKSRILFTPPLPLGVDWTQVTRVGYLLPCRLASDSVEWEHYNQESFVRLQIRTAE